MYFLEIISGIQLVKFEGGSYLSEVHNYTLLF